MGIAPSPDPSPSGSSPHVPLPQRLRHLAPSRSKILDTLLSVLSLQYFSDLDAVLL